MPQPLFFFREFDDHGFLCQWHPSFFTHAGRTYNCAEQWMMYHKAQLAEDERAQDAVMKTKEPRKQKALGRKVVGLDVERWDAVKSEVVEEGNYLKFSQNEELKKRLLETDDRELAEASKFDRVWGIGFTAEDAMKTSREWWGENLLGKALVKVRERIRKEEEEAITARMKAEEEAAEELDRKRSLCCPRDGV